jgi:hypothetical protein
VLTVVCVVAGGINEPYIRIFFKYLFEKGIKLRIIRVVVVIVFLMVRDSEKAEICKIILLGIKPVFLAAYLTVSAGIVISCAAF